MLNGDGLRVVLWLAGCSHHCKNCQNPVTWDPEDGLVFDEAAKQEIFCELYPDSREELTRLIRVIKEDYPKKTIWLYTGFLWEDICRLELIPYLDVLVDGRFVEELKDNNLPWKGSSNQRVIDVQMTLSLGKVVLYA